MKRDITGRLGRRRGAALRWMGVLGGAGAWSMCGAHTPPPAPGASEPALITSIPVRPAPSPEVKTTPIPVAAPSVPDARTQALLNDLETADAGLKSLTAQIMYVKTFPEIQGGGVHVWRGKLEYQDAGKRPDGVTALRRYAVRFETTIVDDQQRAEQQNYIFDGSWLLNSAPAEKSFTRIEVVGPGSNKDPLKIGDGPLPLPIGQRKDDIVARFEASSPEALEGIADSKEMRELRALLETARQLKLTPRIGSEAARTFRGLRIWYRAADNVPIFAQAENLDDSRGEVTLLGIKVNAALPAGTFSTVAPEGYRGDERPLPRNLPRREPEGVSRTLPGVSDGAPRASAPAPIPAPIPAPK
ncbi:hypothetical protein BH11PLA1_BH11PLA1_15790 [soil metagenome]